MQKPNSISNDSAQLQFVVANDPELDYDLVQEVWLNERLLADLRYVEGQWGVTFFMQNKSQFLSLENFIKIQRKFQEFVQEQNQ